MLSGIESTHVVGVSAGAVEAVGQVANMVRERVTLHRKLLEVSTTS
jgi:hypothetical protein